MRYTKILVVITVTTSALLLTLHVLGQATANALALDSPQRPAISLSSGLTPTNPVKIELWLMPDFQNGRVWVDGEITGDHPLPMPFRNDKMTESRWKVGDREHFFGWWQGSQVISISHKLKGAYELQLPGLDLQPDDVLVMRLVSGVILTDTLVPQAVVPVNPTAPETKTLGITLDFTPTAALSVLSDTVLAGSYAFTGLETSPAAGQFVVSPTVKLTTNYTLPRPSLAPTTGGSITPPPFSYTVAVSGEYSLLRLEHISQPLTLTVPFYPFEKAIDLTLTPLLVETMMAHTASATGGWIGQALPGAVYADGYQPKEIRYAQAGMMGRGEIRLSVRTVEDDPQRSALALLTAFRRQRQEQEQIGPNHWRGGLGRLLERHLDFPSFPDEIEGEHTVGELNRHKETLVEITSQQMDYVIQSDAPGLTLEAPFRFNVWRVKDWAFRTWIWGTKEQVGEGAYDCQVQSRRPGRLDRLFCQSDHSPLSPSLQDYAFVDSNSSQDNGQVLHMRLGQIILGPHDVLTLTMENAIWMSFDPLPDKLIDHAQQGDDSARLRGFTAIYRGSRSFTLDILYTPRPTMLTRQSAAWIRGVSRTIEHRVGSAWLRRPLWSLAQRTWLLNENNYYILVVPLALALFSILWIPYQRSIPKQKCPGRSNRILNFVGVVGGKDDAPDSSETTASPEENRESKEQVRTFLSDLDLMHITLRSALVLVCLAIVLVAPKAYPGLYFEFRSISAPIPFAVFMVFSAVSLLRLDTLLYRRGWLLVIGCVVSFAVDVLLNDLYTGKTLYALIFGSVTGILSGATSVGILIGTLFWVGMLFWWSQHEDESRQLQHEDLHAFAFAGLAAATFEVTDASLFAVGLLYVAWFLFSLLLDKARPLNPVHVKPGDPSTAQGNSQKSPLQETADVQKETNAASLKAGEETKLQADEKKSVPTGQETPSQTDQRDESQADKEATTTKEEKTKLDTLPLKLKKFLHPVPIGAILITAIILSQDPLLRTQLASFTQSASPRNLWILWLDPLALLATTLVPCIAIIVLMVFLDTSIEHCLKRRDNVLDIFLKVIPLTGFMYATFMLGIGGLFLFTGALELKLSHRIVYYVTVPILTAIWLDWELPKDWMSTLTGKNPLEVLSSLKDKKIDAKKWFNLILGLLAILAPQLISTANSEDVNAIIKALESLRF